MLAYLYKVSNHIVHQLPMSSLGCSAPLSMSKPGVMLAIANNGSFARISINF